MTWVCLQLAYRLPLDRQDDLEHEFITHYFSGYPIFRQTHRVVCGYTNWRLILRWAMGWHWKWKVGEISHEPYQRYVILCYYITTILIQLPVDWYRQYHITTESYKSLPLTIQHPPKETLVLVLGCSSCWVSFQAHSIWYRGMGLIILIEIITSHPSINGDVIFTRLNVQDIYPLAN